MGRRPLEFIAAALLLVLLAAGVAQGQYEWLLDRPFMPQRGRIGVQVQPMTAELRKHFGAPGDRGLLVTRVESQRPAGRAGLAVGDVIVEAGGRPMADSSDLVRVVAGVAAGGKLELGIVRGGKTQTLVVEPEGEAMPWADPEAWSELFDEGMRKGSRELQRKLRELERRLEQLEDDLEKREAPPATGERTI